MRIATWDSPDPEMRFDNPNLCWGNPSCLLEPGDPGYVPPIPSVNKQTTKRKKMKHNNYYPLRQADQVLWLTNFKDKLSTYATVLSLAPAEVTALLADCAWLDYILRLWLPDVRAWTKSCTEAVTLAETGTGGEAMALPVFTAPALPSGVVAVTPGVLNRLFAQIQLIKKNSACTDAIATDLGILGSEATGPDLSLVQPILKLTVSGSEVLVGWNWNGNSKWLSSCEIMVDRADGKGFVLLTIDTTPNYSDTQPFPAAKAIWTYKAIYRLDDAQVGRWSQPVSVNVGG